MKSTLFLLFIGILFALCCSSGSAFKFGDIKKFFEKDAKKFFQKDAKRFFQKDAKRFFQNAGKKTKEHFQEAWRNTVREANDLKSGETIRMFKTNPIRALHKLHKINPIISLQEATIKKIPIYNKAYENMVRGVENTVKKYTTKQGWEQLKKQAKNPKDLALGIVGDVTSLAPSSTVTEFVGQLGKGAIAEARKRGVKVPKHLDTALNVGLEATSFVKGKNPGKMLKNVGKIKGGISKLSKLKKLVSNKNIAKVMKKSKRVGKSRGIKVGKKSAPKQLNIGRPKMKRQPKGKPKRNTKRKIAKAIKKEVKKQVQEQKNKKEKRSKK